jgi:hypothetical protein
MFFRQCNNEEEKREDDLLNVVVLENKVIVHCKKTKIIFGIFSTFSSFPKMETFPSRSKFCKKTKFILGTFFFIYVKGNLEGDRKFSFLGNGQMFSHTYRILGSCSSFVTFVTFVIS